MGSGEYAPIAEAAGAPPRRRLRTVAMAACAALGAAALVRVTPVGERLARLYVSCDTAGCRDVADDDDYFKDERLVYYETARISLSPEGSAEFRKDLLGFSATVTNYTETTSADASAGPSGIDATATSLCAQTATSNSLNNVVHLDTLSVGTRAGPTKPAAWIESWNELRGDPSAEDWTWDKFAYRASAYYTPDLTLHAKRLGDRGTPHARRWYSSPVDGAKTYLAVFQDPHSGATVELHAPALDAALAAGYGRELEASACPEAIKLGFSADEMRSWWGWRDGRSVGDEGLPDLLLVKVSEPATDLSSGQHFVDRLRGKAVSRWSLEVARGFVGGANATAARESACAYTTSLFYGPELSGSVDFRQVQNDHARDGGDGRTVADWEAYVRDLHGKTLGADSGWDRYMDNRHGLNVGETKDSLDDVKTELDRTSTPYHAHVTSDDGAEGTLYTAGFGGVGVAFHGAFDYTSFDRMTATYFDYCAQTD